MTIEPAKELVIKKLLIFRCYQMDVKDIKCPLQWWEIMKTCLQLVFVLEFFLRIVGSQIETKIIFPLNGIFISLKRCRLQLKNLDNLIFVNKNLPNDPRIGCKCFF